MYIADDALGSLRSQIGDDVTVGTNFAEMPAETQFATHLVVYTKSSLAEQTTPVALNPVDSVANVSNVQFPDYDLDFNDLGGQISWAPPTDSSQVTHYLIYFAYVS